MTPSNVPETTCPAAATIPLVLGTAGHIDHGKTALVKALTGIETDRTPQEKARGISIELGFAALDLGDCKLGIVDVPGHERFIKTMVAGIGGIDLACVVIAADEGIMPQTVEHLDICELMGINAGVVALTKVDLVDEEWCGLVTDEITKALQHHPLRDAAIVPVSSLTGRGLEQLKTEIRRLALATPPRSHRGGFRLPIDRIFSRKGFGTVATGTVVSGQLRVGDDVVAIPSDTEETLRVRGLEHHGDSVEQISAGQRAAVNLAAVAVADLPRGTVLAAPDATLPSHIFDVSLRLSPHTQQSLRGKTRVLLHHGTAQRNAVVELLDEVVLEPGASAFAQIRLARDQPIAAFPGDHFVVRGFTVQAHYGTTLGGGVVTRVAAPRLRRDPSTVATQKTLLAAQNSSLWEEQISLTIFDRKGAGIEAVELAARVGISTEELSESLSRLKGTGEILKLAELFVDARLIEAGKTRLLETLKINKGAVHRAELVGKLPRGTAPAVVERIVSVLLDSKLVQIDGDSIALARVSAIPERLRQPCAAIASRCREDGLTPAKIATVIGDLGIEKRLGDEAVKALRAEGLLCAAPGGWIFHRDPLEVLRTKLVDFLNDHGTITTQQWKTMTGVSRKHAIPLAEYFDQAKVTLRVGDIRKLRSSPGQG